MAIPTEATSAIMEIEEEWSNFSLKREDKSLILYGSDGKTECIFGGLETDMYLTAAELHRSSNLYWQIDKIAYDDTGKKFLILKSEPF